MDATREQSVQNPGAIAPEELTDLIANSPMLIGIFDEHGDCLLSSRLFEMRFARDHESSSGTSLSLGDLFGDPNSADLIMQEIEKEHVIRRREETIVDNEGNSLTALFSARSFPLREQQAFEVVIMDTSEQKRLEEALRHDRAQLQSLIEGVDAGLFMVNNEGVITEFNLWLANMLEMPCEEAIGNHYQDLFVKLLEDATEPEVVQQMLSRAVVSVNERPGIEIARDDESGKYLQISFFPVWEEEGGLIGWGGLVQDVTEKKNQLAWRLELLSILAHDLRAPLAALKGHSTALLANYSQWGEEMVKEFLEAIDRSTDKLIRQVDRSLALTRVETGHLGLRPESFRPEALISEAIERVEGSIGDKGFTVQIPDDLPEVRADPDRVEEALINLLDNAARYSPKGEDIIVEGREEGSMVVISVTDRGPGVPKEDQERIFEKYESADKRRDSSGLGLYISKRIVEAHGGQLWLESPVKGQDAGARFAFTLPVMPTQEAAPEPHRAQAQATKAEPEGEGERVLIVEDEPDFQALLRTIVAKQGFQVEVAAEGATALDVVQTLPPDVILLDWMLPGMDGISICRNIRRWTDAPILMVTSKTGQQDLIEALDAGADDYITKPFKTPELLARMRALLRRGGTKSQEQPNRFTEKGLLINYDSQEVWMRGKRLDLTPTEYDLLAFLARHKGQVLTYEQLLDHLYGDEGERSRHDLFVHISRLRKKIEPDPEEAEFIVTRWGVGYAFLP
jgi:PAS domain S-box-containing protein